MDVINTFSVYPHVAKKCRNIVKSTVQKRQHIVITKIPDFVRLVSLFPSCSRRLHKSSAELLLYNSRNSLPISPVLVSVALFASNEELFCLC